jgi:methylated-DNA-[protein]-cysteine S-methyltransferase
MLGGAGCQRIFGKAMGAAGSVVSWRKRKRAWGAMSRIYYTTMESPVGTLQLVAEELGLRTVWFVRGRKEEKPEAEWKEDPAFFVDVMRQLNAYFAGELREFEIPLLMRGTEFQKRVWKALLAIPYGATMSYGELAKKIGEPKAVRAVGAANGQNPIPIIVPCHRVIGSDGSLTGFGGGLENKKKLLELESRQRRLL